MKKSSLALCLILVTGCATHADIQTPVVTQLQSDNFSNKIVSYNILYSQPQPGIFSSGSQTALKPLEESELSIASAVTLKNLPEYIYKQLPASVKKGTPNTSDFNLEVDLIAHDKRGPAYADYEAMKSFGKGMLTFGLGSSEYNIIADFDITYKLTSHKKEIYTKSYKIKDSIDHQRGQLESFNSLNDFSGQLLEKHLMLTLNSFFKDADLKL
jgi:hypothetical protein